MELFDNERLNLDDLSPNPPSLPDDEVNAKYVEGHVRIVTEQARYPLPSIANMVESDDYELNPEFQRRHRWNDEKKSRLIESFIMNVPIPPIFLYEDEFSHYEVMDGLQRLTAIHEFYKDRLVLEGLEKWPELNGRKYSELPNQVRRGVDRRYLSSIILLQETAKDPKEAQRLKQMVFERINSGGIKLEPQETRNAIYNGPLNQMCIKLARNEYLCKAWGIPVVSHKQVASGDLPPELMRNKRYRKMKDVELVLRFFAYRQRLRLQSGALRDYLDEYLKFGNLYSDDVLNKLKTLFQDTVELVYKTFGKRAFWLYRKRETGWIWYKRPTTVIYDPMMWAFSRYLDRADSIIGKKEAFRKKIKSFYKNNYDEFKGKYTNRANIRQRNELFNDFVDQILG